MRTLAKQAMGRIDKQGYRRGKDRSELYDLARMSQAFKDRVGDAGTATQDFIAWLAQSSSHPQTAGKAALGALPMGLVGRTYLGFRKPGLGKDAVPRLMRSPFVNPPIADTNPQG